MMKIPGRACIKIISFNLWNNRRRINETRIGSAGHLDCGAILPGTKEQEESQTLHYLLKQDDENLKDELHTLFSKTQLDSDVLADERYFLFEGNNRKTHSNL